ncbi:hypothetical protein DFH09DRAFT_1302927 [Mycena vulgaris]|nr:hypothetical protein DFH09DRAFT_1302927 [Mycena vulgaris]
MENLATFGNGTLDEWIEEMEGLYPEIQDLEVGSLENLRLICREHALLTKASEGLVKRFGVAFVTEANKLLKAPAIVSNRELVEYYLAVFESGYANEIQVMMNYMTLWGSGLLKNATTTPTIAAVTGGGTAANTAGTAAGTGGAATGTGVAQGTTAGTVVPVIAAVKRREDSLPLEEVIGIAEGIARTHSTGALVAMNQIAAGKAPTATESLVLSDPSVPKIKQEFNDKLESFANDIAQMKDREVLREKRLLESLASLKATTDPDPDPDSSDESSLTLSSLFPSPAPSLSRTSFTPETSPAPPVDPATLLTALTTATTTVTTRSQPRHNDMTDTNIKLFKGSNVGGKIEDFELSLKDGSYASLWLSKLTAVEKKLFKDLTAAFRLQWPAKEMVEKSKGELQEELLSLALDPAAVGVRVEEDSIQEWGHVRWARKVAELGTRVDKDGGLITQVLKNIPDSLCLQLGPKRETWAELVQAMKDIPTANMGSLPREEYRISGLEAGLIAANATIPALQQTPTRGLAAAFSGMAASSPARACVDPVRRTLFPAANTAAKPAQRYRPDQKRLQMIRAGPVTIHLRTPAGQAAYAQQIIAYTQAHSTGKPFEDRPYPLTPGTVAVGSGECHQCGQIGHFFDKCTVTAERRVLEMELRWRQIVQSIISRIGRAQREATAVNVVADAIEEVDGDVFSTYPSAEYDQLVIEEFLAQQGKGRGPSA